MADLANRSLHRSAAVRAAGQQTWKSDEEEGSDGERFPREQRENPPNSSPATGQVSEARPILSVSHPSLTVTGDDEFARIGAVQLRPVAVSIVDDDSRHVTMAIGAFRDRIRFRLFGQTLMVSRCRAAVLNGPWVNRVID